MTSSTTDRRLGLAGNTGIKTPCRAATTTNITLTGTQTIDSVSVVSGDRVLVKDQTATTENGIYVCDTGTWERDLDADGNQDWKQGTLVFVTSGSANGAGLFEQTTADPITVGTTSMAFTKIATLAASAVTQVNVQNGQFITLTSVAGTNTITGTTVGTAPSSLGGGQYVFFVPANTNTGATTLNRDSLGALSIFYNGAALIGGELQANIPVLLYDDGTQYQLMSTAVSDLNFQTRGTVSSASTINLNTAKPYSQITGVTQIDTITLGNGRVRIVEFASTLQLTNSANLILQTGASITTAAGDTAAFVGEGSSVTRCLFYQRATGNTVNGSTLVVRSNLAGLGMSTAGSSATMSIAAGQATDSGNAQSMSLSASIDKTTSAWAVGSAAGGLDTGAIANSTWYHFYLIQRPDTGVVDVLFSLSATSPTMPTNYTLKRRIGSGKTNGSSQWTLFTQVGDYFRWSASVLDVTATNPGTSSVTATLASVPTGVKVKALINITLDFPSANDTIYVRDLSASDEAALATTAAPGVPGVTNTGFTDGLLRGTQIEIMTNTSAQIGYRVSASGASNVVGIVTYGWTDRRGRDD